MGLVRVSVRARGTVVRGGKASRGVGHRVLGQGRFQGRRLDRVGLRYVRSEWHFNADYIRGRRIKTRIIVRSNGTCTIETIGRGKAAVRWLERLKGKKLMQVVDSNR